MAEELVTIAALARFHREVLLPDMERILAVKLNAMELRLNVRLDEWKHATTPIWPGTRR